MCVDGGSVVKQSAWTQELGDTASTPGWGRNPGGGHGDPPQHSCLENPPGRGAGWLQSTGHEESGMTEAT